MGQQQLILLVLATVIVGLATVVGIRAFSENSLKSNADALVQDAIRIAADAQAWKLKPQAMGGQQAGGAKTTLANYTGIDFAVLGYPTNAANAYVNTNGTCTIVGAEGGATIDCTSAGGTGAYANLATANAVTVEVTGITDEDIETTNVTIGAY
jgi:hypothetical protein